MSSESTNSSVESQRIPGKSRIYCKIRIRYIFIQFSQDPHDDRGRSTAKERGLCPEG